MSLCRRGLALANGYAEITDPRRPIQQRTAWKLATVEHVQKCDQCAMATLGVPACMVPKLEEDDDA